MSSEVSKHHLLAPPPLLLSGGPTKTSDTIRTLVPTHHTQKLLPGRHPGNDTGHFPQLRRQTHTPDQQMELRTFRTVFFTKALGELTWVLAVTLLRAAWFLLSVGSLGSLGSASSRVASYLAAFFLPEHSGLRVPPGLAGEGGRPPLCHDLVPRANDELRRRYGGLGRGQE